MRFAWVVVMFACTSTQGGSAGAPAAPTAPAPPVASPAPAVSDPGASRTDIAARLNGEKLDPKDPVSLKSLFVELEPLASKWLAEDQVFAPFGAGINTKGEVELMMSGDVQADSQQQLSMLVRRLGEPQYEAGILLVDTRIVPPGGSAKTDAIWVITENRSGFVRHLDMPYAIVGGKITWGTPFRTPGERAMIYPVP